MALKDAVEGNLKIQLLWCDSAMPGCILLVDELDGKYGFRAVNGRCFLDATSQQSAHTIEYGVPQRTKRMLPARWSLTRSGRVTRWAEVPIANALSCCEPNN